MSVLTKVRGFSDRLKASKPTLWELVVFYLMGGIVMVVDLGAFALFNYLLFTKLRGVAVQWWLFDYTVDNGGLCALLSLACSFALSQTVNFFLQRKVTFGATSNVLYSAVMYAVMVIGVYFLILWLPTFFYAPVCRLLGDGLGSFVVKLATEFISALIQFPMNKWVIMRSDK